MVQPFGKLEELSWRRPWIEKNISARALFESSSSRNRASWPYFFSGVDHLPAQLRSDLGALLPKLSTPFLPAIETNLWAGVPNVSSPLHYDAAHNVYCQMVGRRRWQLVPPEESFSLYPYPRLHPSTRQSRINLRDYPPADDGRSGRFNRLFGRSPLRILEGVLAPGDRLYVPPYWWHSVAVEDGYGSALAVAVYSQSTPMRAYGILKEHPLPDQLRGCKARCDGDPNGACCLPSLRAYVLALAALHPPDGGASHIDDDGHSFACAIPRRCVCFADADAYERRYGVLATEMMASTAIDDPGVAIVRELLETRYRHLDDPEIVEGMPQMLRAARERMRARVGALQEELTPADAASLRAHARRLRERVIAMPSKGDGVVTRAMWRMEMHSLVEDVASAAVGAREVEAVMAWIAGEAV